MKKLVFCLGTRPEAIKLAPMILAARSFHFEPFTCLTGQHKELIEPINSFFKIRADANLEAMAPGQSLHQLTAKIVTGMETVLKDTKPSAIVVQGDTTSALVGALAAFYLKIPIAHVEAGLRTKHMDNPFPEEMNRRLIGRMANFHFAPTPLARENLLKEGLKENILVTGNTGIDALRISVGTLTPDHMPLEVMRIPKGKRILLATVHRRENFDNLEQIFGAFLRITRECPDVEIVFPVHMNPIVHEHSQRLLSDNPQIHLLAPLNYPQLISVMKACHLVLSDSGGLQEEAPYFEKPVLVLRTSTEREEGVIAGTSLLVGNTEDSISNQTLKILRNQTVYDGFKKLNPYGDGYATGKIFDFLSKKL